MLKLRARSVKVKPILRRLAYVLALVAVVGSFVRLIDTERNADIVVGGAAKILSQLPQSSTIDLNGKWEFYPNQLLAPEDFARRKYRPVFLDVPRTWQGQYVDGGKFPVNLFGTYRLRLETPQNSGDTLGLIVDVVRSSNKVFVNGELIGHAGYPGVNEFTTVSDIRVGTYFFTARPQNEIIIQVANFVNSKRGGIITPVAIGSAASVYSSSVHALAADVMLMIVFLIILAIFAGQYFQRNKEQELLWFSCFCLFSLFLYSTLNSRLILFAVPDLPYETVAKISYVSVNWAVFSIFMYVRAALKMRFLWFTRVMAVMMSLLTLVLIYLPLLMISDGLVYMLVWTATLVFVTVAFMVRGVLARTEGYEYLAFGVVCFLVLYLATACDYMGMLDSDWFVAVISSCYMVSQLLFITERHRLNMLKRQQSALELEYLRAQIKPHFIFNALGSIGGLMLEDVSKARRTLSDFSRFLRGMFRKENQKEYISVEEELQITEYYLRIEKVRYGDRLDVTIAVSEDTRRERLAPLTLQPIVENSIKHGFENSCNERIAISIISTVRKGRLCIEISDNGTGIDEAMLAEISKGNVSGIGIGNTMTRLRRVGGDLLFENTGGGLKVTVVLPVIHG